MSRSGEKHAQDYNLMWCISIALRVVYFLAVIYGDPVGAFNNEKAFYNISNLRCSRRPSFEALLTPAPVVTSN